MKALKSFYKRNPIFVIFFVVAIIGLVTMETANVFLGFFPDKGVGFLGAGIFFVILLAAFVVEDKIEI